MNTPSNHPVDEALELLRQDDVLERPNPELERRLRQCFQRRRFGRGLRRAAVLLVAIGLSAALVEATVGLEALRTWWVEIVIDGQRMQGPLNEDGEQTFEYTTQDGCRVSVRVHRRQTGPDAVETGIQVNRRTPDGRKETRIELETIEGTDEPSRARLERTSLAGATRLHDWIDGGGQRCALFWQDVPESDEGRLLVEYLDSSATEPVLVIGRTRRGPGPDTRASLVENSLGGLEIELADDSGWQYAIGFAHGPLSDGSLSDDSTEIVTPDGRVRFRFDNERD